MTEASFRSYSLFSNLYDSPCLLLHIFLLLFLDNLVNKLYLFIAQSSIIFLHAFHNHIKLILITLHRMIHYIPSHLYPLPVSTTQCCANGLNAGDPARVLSYQSIQSHVLCHNTRVCSACDKQS
eukprot:622592_1